MSEDPHCARCGTSRAGADPVSALAWVTERTGPASVLRWLCPSCARRHARDIEGKLPAEWW